MPILLAEPSPSPKISRLPAHRMMMGGAHSNRLSDAWKTGGEAGRRFQLISINDTPKASVLSAAFLQCADEVKLPAATGANCVSVVQNSGTGALEQ